MVKRPKSLHPASADPRPGNRLLARLPREEFDRIRPHLRSVAVKTKQIFHSINEPIRDVVFPNGGVASVTTVLQDGTSIECATVGDEGFLGIEVLLGGKLSTSENLLQVPDTSAEYLPVSVFKSELDHRGHLHDSVQRYAQAYLALMMHSTACIALHPVQERCCRWLLMTHDRVHSDEFQLSHEFLAIMLGSTRPTVTVVAGTLQKAGLITYKHGHMRVLDRKGLEAGSCECYATVRSQFDRLGI